MSFSLPHKAPRKIDLEKCIILISGINLMETQIFLRKFPFNQLTKMILIKLTLVLLFFGKGKTDKVKPDKQDDQNLQRRYYPFGYEDLQPITWSEPIYKPFVPNYPIFAEITPINERFQKISDSFRGYIYPNMISQVYYPYYSVICENPPQGQNNDIEMIRQNQLEPLKLEMNELTEKLKTLTDLFIKHFSPSNESSDREPTDDADNLKTSPKDDVNKPLDPQKQDFPASPAIGKIPKTEKKKSKLPKKQKVPASFDNDNVQSNVFQCEGLTCPDETQTCKITEQAIEPSYVDIQKTVFCLSSDNKVLLKKESKTKNPNKGSSLNNSRTFNKNDIGKIKDINMAMGNTGFNDFDTGNINTNFGNMENDFEKAMEQFNLKMTKAFGTR